jgi:hypothetical protein
LCHGASRGNARAAIFHSDADRERFLAQLCDILSTYDDCRALGGLQRADAAPESLVEPATKGP